MNVTDWLGCTALDIARDHYWSNWDNMFNESRDNHKAMIDFLKERGAAGPCSEKRYAEGAYTDDEEEGIDALGLRDALYRVEQHVTASEMSKGERDALMEWGAKTQEQGPHGVRYPAPKLRSEGELTAEKRFAGEAAQRLLDNAGANRTLVIQCLRKIYQRQHQTSPLLELRPQ